MVYLMVYALLVICIMVYHDSDTPMVYTRTTFPKIIQWYIMIPGHEIYLMLYHGIYHGTCHLSYATMTALSETVRSESSDRILAPNDAPGRDRMLRLLHWHPIAEHSTTEWVVF
jgi:hypothetical protein